MIYLDAAATSGYSNIDDIIVDTMTLTMRDSWINPSSLYAANVKDKVNKCRVNVAEFINAKPDEIYYTSGGSESNSWAIQGFVNQCFSEGKKPCVITSTIEHKSIIECVNNLNYADVNYINVDEYGFVNVDELRNTMLEKALSDYKILVSIQFANNEVGTIQDIKVIAEEVHRFNGVLHTDAVQAFGHIPINVEDLGVDLMSVSAHKISPVLRGIGFLYKKNGVNIQPIIYGSQESGLRGGTTNTYGIIGLNKALEYCDISQKKIDEICKKRDYFISLLESKFDCELNGDSYYRLPNNVNVTFSQNITGEALLYMLDMSDIKISTSSACNSKEVLPSHVLKAIGLTDENAMKTVRITLSNDVTYEEIHKTVEEIGKSIKLIET
ncbi:MAG: cysteine desulfurase [Paludibacteraceae bacterium]|nr:cysteine desulfurase [Paludibacteraceae bacterium]